MDLNTILIILGVIALIALVVHGLWSNRREKSKYFKSANTFNRTSKNGEVNPFSQAADPNADIRLTHRAQAAQPVHKVFNLKWHHRQQANSNLILTSNVLKWMRVK